jgi:leucyl-tRNA---protein transferase
MVRQYLVYDAFDSCPYLPGRIARFPLRVSERNLRREELDAALADGDRRQGVFLYRPSCPSCTACEAIRLNVAEFEPSASLRRVLARADATVTMRVGPAVADAERAALYTRHKWGRGLASTDEVPAMDVAAYRAFLVDSCCDTVEFACRLKQELVAVAVADRGRDSLSAVYCAFDPARSKLSLGTYCILKQWEACCRWGLKYLYLGLYVSDCRHLSYKARFLPHERLIAGRWQRFTREQPRAIAGARGISAEPHADSRQR